MATQLPKEWIEHCQDEDVCHICGRTVVYGPDSEGVYTLTGAHYNCQFPGGRARREELRDLIAKADSMFGVDTPQSDEPALARANGGSLLHWVIPRSGRALCGHAPSRNASRMRQRGKWLYLPTTADTTRSTFCSGCAARMSRRQQSDTNE